MKYLISLLTIPMVLIIFGAMENAKAQSLLGVYGDWTAYTKNRTKFQELLCTFKTNEK